LRAGALEGESASWPRQASASSYFIDSKKHQHGSTPGKRTRLDQAHGLARCWPPARAAAPRQQAAAQPWPPARAAPARPKQPGNPGQRTRLDQAHGGTHPAKGWPPERARRGHRSPGKGLPWAGGALRAGAFAAFPKRKKPGARAGRVNRKEGGSGLLAARRRPL